jgi:hypothetical protein
MRCPPAGVAAALAVVDRGGPPPLFSGMPADATEDTDDLAHELDSSREILRARDGEQAPRGGRRRTR